MKSNSSFGYQQHSLRKVKSCITQIIEVMDDWTSKLGGNDNIDVIYMDFQKAFDSVPHERLKKLHSYGIQRNLLGWIKNFQEAKSHFKWSSILHYNSNKRYSARKCLRTSSIYYHLSIYM